MRIFWGDLSVTYYFKDNMLWFIDMKKIHDHLFLNSSKEFFLINFLNGLANAGFVLFPPIYFSLIGLGDSITSFIQFGIVFLVFICSFFLANFIERFNEYKIFLFAFLGISLTYLSFALSSSIFVFIFLLVLLSILKKIRVDVSAVLFRDMSTIKEYVKNRSKLSMIGNISWIFGPIVFGLILKTYGETSLLFMCMALALTCFILLLRFPFKTKVKKRIKIDANVRANISSFLKNKGLRRAYMFRFSLRVWYSVQFFFIPYFMIQKGFGEDHVGFFIGAIGIPLVIIQAKLASLRRKFGLRKIFAAVYTLLILVAAASFIFEGEFMVILAVFFIGGFAFACLEVLPEIYFFESLESDLDEEKYISIFSSASNLASMIGQILIGTLFVFLPFQYMFILLLVLSLYMLKLSLNLKKR